MNSRWFENALDTRPALMSASALAKRASIARRWRILAVNDEFWGENDLAHMGCGLHEIAVMQTHPGTDARGNGHLPIPFYLNDAHPDSLALWCDNLQARETFEVLTVEGADSLDAVRRHGRDKLQIEDSCAAHGIPAQQTQPS
jgi:hypothetical protein